MMQPFSITVVAGARPNFMKIAPIVRALNARKRPHKRSCAFQLMARIGPG